MHHRVAHGDTGRHGFVKNSSRFETQDLEERGAGGRVTLVTHDRAGQLSIERAREVDELCVTFNGYDDREWAERFFEE